MAELHVLQGNMHVWQRELELLKLPTAHCRMQVLLNRIKVLSQAVQLLEITEQLKQLLVQGTQFVLV